MFDKIFKKSKSKNSAFQEGKQAFPNNIPIYLNLDKHFHRLLEIEEALGEIGSIFEHIATVIDPSEDNAVLMKKIAETANKLRIPGFFAYHLAQEGFSLLHILSAICAIAKKNKSFKKIAHLDTIVSHIDKVEPTLRQTLNDMEPYKNMDAKEAVEVLAVRFAQQKKV